MSEEKQMRWWQKPMSVEDIELIAHHALLRDPGSVRSYVMVDGVPVYQDQPMALLAAAIRGVIPAFERMGQAFVDLAAKFDAIGENFPKEVWKRAAVSGAERRADTPGTPTHPKENQ